MHKAARPAYFFEHVIRFAVLYFDFIPRFKAFGVFFHDQTEKPAGQRERVENLIAYRTDGGELDADELIVEFVP